jgi:hypothetical protein
MNGISAASPRFFNSAKVFSIRLMDCDSVQGSRFKVQGCQKADRIWDIALRFLTLNVEL